MLGKTCMRREGAPSLSHMYRAASGEEPPTTGPTIPTCRKNTNERPFDNKNK